MNEVAAAFGDGKLLVFQPARARDQALTVALGVQRLWFQALRAPTALTPVVHEIASLLRRTIPARIALDVDIDPGVPPVDADATQIHQVLMNLGTNAWHAIRGPVGRIQIALTTADVDRPAGAAGWAQITVRDNGCGMDPATLERIFEPFFTTKAHGHGTGLGLSVVHGIIAEHGGEIRVESSPGAGTTVSVMIPLLRSDYRADPPSTATAPPPVVGWRVVIIDDDPVLAAVGAALLEHLGHQSISFTTPAAALAALRAAPDDFDLVITDYNMPHFSGLDVAASVAALRPSLPVVLVSGHASLGDDELARVGIRHRLHKPYTLENLAEVIGALQAATIARSMTA